MKYATLITGASNGIGLEFAKICASKKQDLVLTARSESKLRALQLSLMKQYSIKIWIIIKDLSVAGAAQEIFEEITSQNIHIDYLINNAGFGDYGLFHESEWKKQEQMMLLNMVSLAHLCRLFIPEMIKSKSGKILNIASVAAFNPGPTMAVYFATKAFVLQLSEAMHEELKPHGVFVTALCPGPTATGFVDAAGLQKSKFFNRKLPTAGEIAHFGYLAMEKNKAIAIPGITNQLQVFILRIIPRKLIRSISLSVLSKKNDRLFK